MLSLSGVSQEVYFHMGSLQHGSQSIHCSLKQALVVWSMNLAWSMSLCEVASQMEIGADMCWTATRRRTL